MPDDQITPAVETVVETPPAASVAAPAPERTDTPVAPTTSTPPARQEFDLDQVLADDEHAKKIVAHPRIKQTIDGIVGARLQQERERQRQADATAAAQRAIEDRQRELDQLAASPDLEMVPAARDHILHEQEAVTAERARLAQQQREAERELDRQTGATLGTMMRLGTRVNALYNAKNLTREEWETLQPERFADHGPAALDDFENAVWETLLEKHSIAKAEKLLRERLPIEVEAKVQERLGEQRDGATNLPNLPAGTPTVHYTRRDLANMSPEDYQRNRDLILGPIIRR